MKKFLKTLCIALVAIVTGVAITACKPSNVEKAEAKMEEAGYTVITLGEDADDAEGLIGGFIATDVDLVNGTETISALLFDSKDNAKKFYEKWVSEDSNEKVKQNGKWVYVGTDAAVEVFEG